MGSKLNCVTVKFTSGELAIVERHARIIGVPIATYLRTRSLLPIGRLKTSLEQYQERRSKSITVKYDDRELEVVHKRSASVNLNRATYIRIRSLQSIVALKRSIDRQNGKPKAAAR
ncbi:MAG: hypothetical protein HC778_01250 [Chamaesiphon sp. CSU_1_12]|nr:hypothetical protein [Chamaesiphon sp. CSU_1_12]